MVNIGLNITTILGLLQIAAALGAFVISMIQMIAAVKRQHSADVWLRIVQLVVVPLALLLSGVILVFNGWRLDPILQFQQLLMLMLLGFFLIVDWIRSFNSLS